MVKAEIEIIDLEKRINELLEKAIREVRDRIIKELFKEIIEILKVMASHLTTLTERVNQLTARVDELTERVNQLTTEVSRLTGAVGSLRGRMAEWEIVDGLKGILRRFGLEIFKSPWKSFDAYIMGDGFLAIVEICVNCRKGDVDQVKRAIGPARDIFGARPDVLVVYSLEKPRKEVVKYAERMGVIIENSPIRLSKKLREIMKKKAKNRA